MRLRMRFHQGANEDHSCVRGKQGVIVCVIRFDVLTLGVFWDKMDSV